MAIPDSWKTVDWESFWLREALFLGAPALFSIYTIPRGDTLQIRRLGILLAVLLALTFCNIIWASLSRSEKPPSSV